MEPYGLFLFLNYLTFFELCVSEAGLISTAGSLQIRVLCQTESLCNRKREKKKKKEHTQNIPKAQTPASKSIFYSTIKDNMKMLI